MPSYHFSAQIIGRKSGRSSVAAAAYRAGEKLRDDRNGQEFDFSKRRGIAEREILLPEGAAPWLGDRTRLWNHVEAMEKRKDAQLAREINIALPHELTDAQRVDLVRDFVREQFVSRGMVADIAWHDPVPEKGDDERNFHAHVMLTLRQAQAEGLRAVKTREWNSDTLMDAWRAAWADHQNRALERAGVRSRVDHRALDEQRREALQRGDRRAAECLDREPEIHVGPKARAAERKGRVPRSQERMRNTARSSGGVWRSSGVPEKRHRPVCYERIDDGSRGDYDARILQANIRKARSRVDKLERQAFRLRERGMRAARILAMPTLPSQARQRYGIVLTTQRLQMAKRHQARANQLLKDVERLIAELFHVRDLWHQRHRDLLRIPGVGRPDGRFRF